MGAALTETGERGMSTPTAAVLLKDASTDECRFVGGEDGCRKRPKAVESSWERESTVEIDMSVESECWASPVVRPTLDELQRFPEYVQEHLAEWEPYGLVVVQLPDQLDMNALLELPEVAERVMQQTRARPRVQRFPQFRSRRDDRGGSWSSKRSRLFDAPAFAESGHDCTLAQHREHAQTEAARITTRLLGDGDRSPEGRVEELERHFWQMLQCRMPLCIYQALYVIDVPHWSGFRRHLDRVPWAPRHANRSGDIGAGRPRLLSLLRFVHDSCGISSPMGYFGSAFSRFGMHVEDAYLFSLSFHHGGAAKVWYSVPPACAAMLEAAVGEWLSAHPDAAMHSADATSTVAALTSKTLLVPPRWLRARGIPVYRAVHTAHQLVLTLPQAYHYGFNCGWNVAESVNWAVPSWLPHGERARERERALGRPGTVCIERLVLWEALWRASCRRRRRRVDGSSARPLHAHLLAVGERERRFRQRCVESFAAAPDTERLHAECFYGTDAATRAAQRLIELWRCARAARPRGWSHGARTTAWRALITALRDTWPQQPLWCTRCRAVCGVSLLVCLECVRWHNGTLTGVLCPADLDTAQDVADKRVHLRNAHSGSAQQAPHSPLPVLVVSIVPHETELHTLADTLLH
ncbi:hypothetical protein CDCA_CDCA01G0080 [Cyanidium caldarium]|uniref:JmjC domain-containing protein n=1 Tax=Cyanidium caldarium TaxID=2771 RepID=A0AAV9IPN3_CYACA|nr:hypothetical protein CDCA_CDCA01G0080 [Cyanidium caldarium]